MNIFSKIVTAVVKVFAKTEDVVHEPLYPIKTYISKVSDTLWRGSWPTDEMLDQLKADGVEVILNFCAEREEKWPEWKRGFVALTCAVQDGSAPTTAQVCFFLRIAQFRRIYAHCEEGVGRTGCFVASYRVRVQGWVPEAALKEAESFGTMMPVQKEFILNL